MEANFIVLAVIEALNKVQIPYMIVGSLSSNAYGIERSTKDADFVVQLGTRSLSELMKWLPGDFNLESQIGFETVAATTRYRIGYAPLAFTVELFEVSDEAHDQLRFANRVATTYLGLPSFLPRAEDVIITKLRWSGSGKARIKDIDDINNIFAVQTVKRLDLSYIRFWADQHGTRELLEKLLTEIPEV